MSERMKGKTDRSLVHRALTVWGEDMSAQMWDDRLRIYFRPGANTTTTAEYELGVEDVESLRMLLNAAHARETAHD